MIEFLIFGGFYALAFVAHTVQHRHAGKVWHVAHVSAVPALWHAVQDFAVHLTVYSGYVIPPH